MIVVEICSNRELISAFTVSGHAGMAEYGQDIFCAAVSSITQTALLGLLQQVYPPAAYNKSSGYMQVTLARAMDQANSSKAQTILLTMLAGLKYLAEENPEFLKIVTRRC